MRDFLGGLECISLCVKSCLYCSIVIQIMYLRLELPCPSLLYARNFGEPVEMQLHTKFRLRLTFPNFLLQRFPGVDQLVGRTCEDVAQEKEGEHSQAIGSSSSSRPSQISQSSSMEPAFPSPPNRRRSSTRRGRRTQKCRRQVITTLCCF